VQWPLLAIQKRSGLDCAEKTNSVDCSKIVVSLDFLFTFLSRKKWRWFGCQPKRKAFFMLLGF